MQPRDGAHFIPVRRKARLFCDDNTVYVFDMPASFGKQGVYLPQKLQRAGILIGWVSGRKVLANVAEASCSQERVHYCVHEHVGI